MIPVRLELRDFLSYAERATIDFTGFSVACLTGDNGSGKSALLDAMTWALWARARGCEGGTNQDRLIRDGADEAFVDFTFELQGQTYRVVRRRSRSGKRDVRFLLADNDEWRNLGSETLRETDEKIETTLRMDYRTFAASAFFVQGRSDDFLRMTPNHRKEVFSQLLDLDTYERLAEIARQGAREADRRRSVHNNDVEQFGKAREHVQRVTADLADARALLAASETTTVDAKATADQARSVLASYEKAEAVVETERTQFAAARLAVDQLTTAIELKEQTLAETDALLARTQEVDERLFEADELSTQDQVARASQEHAARLSSRRAEVAERIEGDRRTLQRQQNDATAHLGRLEQETAELDALGKKLRVIESSLAESNDPGSEIEEVRSQLESHSAAIVRAEEQMKANEQRSVEVKDKIAMLARDEGECPVCGTPLDAVHRTKVKQSLQSESRELVHAKDGAKAGQKTARKDVARCAEELRRLQRAREDRDKLVAAQTELRARLQRAPAVAGETTTVQHHLDGIGKLLEEDAFASVLREELATIDVEISSAYDAAGHRQILERMRELKPYEALKGRLTEAARSRSALVVELSDAKERVTVADKEARAHETRLAELEGRLGPPEPLHNAVREAEAALARAHEAATEASTSSATLEERRDVARRDLASLEAAEAAEKDAALEHRRYHRLAEAFGRSGIPQRIIENERPQLEHEANRILDRLTDDPMAVQFQFQKELRSGQPRETLDVLVRPHDGDPRDFAMFSGGEAFRIAFAVRLAMSKLLVRRAGARLQTLVIDEGFGTQDPQGRERLIEAINLAREEFAKVLVITHLEDLKDQFEVQIAVRKGPSGSLIEIQSG